MTSRLRRLFDRRKPPRLLNAESDPLSVSEIRHSCSACFLESLSKRVDRCRIPPSILFDGDEQPASLRKKGKPCRACSGRHGPYLPVSWRLFRPARRKEDHPSMPSGLAVNCSAAYATIRLGLPIRSPMATSRPCRRYLSGHGSRDLRQWHQGEVRSASFGQALRSPEGG